MASLYSGSFPAVLEDGDYSKSPWIKPADIANYGAVQVWSKSEDAMPDMAPDGEMSLPWRKRKHKENELRKIYWHISAPKMTCSQIMD